MSQENEELNQNSILVVILISYLLIVLDMNIVTTALPSIKENFNMSTITLSWVQNAYLVSFGGFLLISGKLADMYGHTKLLNIGIIIFSLSSLVIGISQTKYELIFTEFTQGIGAAIIAPCVLALITLNFKDGEERTRALTWYSIIAGAGASIGLILGGIFTTYFSWRIGFLINVPVGLVLLLLIKKQGLTDQIENKKSLDIWGTISSIGAIGLVIFTIVRFAEYSVHDFFTIISLLGAIIFIYFFIKIEKKAKNPVLPLELFCDRQRVIVLIVRMCFIGSIIGFFFFNTQFMQLVLGFSPLLAGLAFLILTIPTFISAIFLPYLTKKYGDYFVLIIALSLMATAYIWIGMAGENVDFFYNIALPMMILGFGNGLGLAPLTSLAMRGVKDKDNGAASSLVNVAHQVGGSLGLGLMLIVFSFSGSSSNLTNEVLSHKIGITNTFAGIMVLVGISIILILVRKDKR